MKPCFKPRTLSPGRRRRPSELLSQEENRYLHMPRKRFPRQSVDAVPHWPVPLKSSFPENDR